MATASARVRDAARADLHRIVELLAQLSLAGESREDLGRPLSAAYERAFEEMASDRRQRLLVAEAGGQIVGTAALIIVPNLSHRGRPYALIEDVVVDTTHRGRGVGEALVRYMVEAARAAGCYRVSLTSNKARVDAHRFYRRLGFTASHEGFRVAL